MSEFKYNIVDGFDFPFDEKGNVFLALRKLTWGDNNTPRLDIRKWYVNSSGEETLGKGVSFLTDEGPHELVNVLLQNNFGRTDEVIEGIKDRDDFEAALNKVLLDKGITLGKNNDSEDYYDPKESLLD